MDGWAGRPSTASRSRSARPRYVSDAAASQPPSLSLPQPLLRRGHKCNLGCMIGPDERPRHPTRASRAARKALPTAAIGLLAVVLVSCGGGGSIPLPLHHVADVP